jgi:hypothetical protein
MNRKQFLQKACRGGLCACGAALGFGQSLSGKRERTESQVSPPADERWIPELERRMIKGAETPAWRKLELAGLWIKDLMQHLDSLLDQETKVRLMQACGRSCYTRAFGVAAETKPTAGEREQYLRLLESRGFKIQRGDKVLSFTYNWGRDHQNPTGLIMRDGYCMCPQVESGPPGLSPTYCYCSTGYVQESFERALGTPVRVELVESLKMGGKDCVFRVEVLNI